MSNFHDRLHAHAAASRIFHEHMETLSKEWFWVGYENHGPELVDRLKTVNTEMALFVRHHPDGLGILNENRLFYFDIKSDPGCHARFSIETDSLYSALEFCRINKPVYMACVDLQDETVKVIHSTNLNSPKTIYLPERVQWRYDEYRRKFPNSTIKLRDSTQGSDTSYILVPKNCKAFISLREFVEYTEFKPYSFVSLVEGKFLEDGTVQMQFEEVAA